jgi:hypothetical protein
MEHLEKIIDLADAELGTIVKNGKFRSREEISAVGELIDMVKDIHCIWDYESEDEDEMSGYSGRSSYRGGDDYSGRSYARDRRGARRDSMGRYSGDYSMRGYSCDGRDSFADSLRDAIRDAPDEQTKQAIQRMIDKM